MTIFKPLVLTTLQQLLLLILINSARNEET